VLDAKKKLDESGADLPLDRVPTDVVEHHAQQESGPELNAEAVEAARKDRQPEPPVQSGS
jgi:protein phosphatase PTC1